jgi:hypothetical protein
VENGGADFGGRRRHHAWRPTVELEGRVAVLLGAVDVGVRGTVDHRVGSLDAQALAHGVVVGHVEAAAVEPNDRMPGPRRSVDDLPPEHPARAGDDDLHRPRTAHRIAISALSPTTSR